MFDHTRRRRIVAFLAGLAVATTVSVVAPAAATARPVGTAPSSKVVLHDQPAKGSVGSSKHVNDWIW